MIANDKPLFVLLVGDTGEPVLERFATPPEMVAYLQQHLADDAVVYAGQGQFFEFTPDQRMHTPFGTFSFADDAPDLGTRTLSTRLGRIRPQEAPPAVGEAEDNIEAVGVENEEAQVEEDGPLPFNAFSGDDDDNDEDED